MANTRIFVSYRHDDTAEEVAALVERLARTQAGIFRDTAKIQVAQHFPRKLEKALGEAGIVVVVIGKIWLGISDSSGRRRLDDPDDFVRREIVYALERAEADCFLDIVPVLMNGAKMPREADLPLVLKPLAAIDALSIRRSNFLEGVDRLSLRIDELYGEHSDRAGGELDEIDDYLSAKDITLADTMSMNPTFAQNPDLHDLPHAAEWLCTQQNVFELKFETFDNLYFEGELTWPHNVTVEGTWAYKPRADKTLVLELSGKTFAGFDFSAVIPIQEKVGRQSYGGTDASGQYYRLECTRRKDDMARTF